MKKDNVLLKEVELRKVLKQLPLWTLPKKDTALVRTLTFKNHIDALVCIARITVHAQVLNHHPEILFTYKKVKISISTHELKGISKLDIEFAKRVDSLCNAYSG